MTTNHFLERAKKLKLYGVVAHWETVVHTPWIEELLTWEETERSQRSLERRLAYSHIGRFKPLAQFDWSWPRKCDREAVEELMQLEFLKEAINVIFCGPNGVGKSTMARNIAYQAVLQGHTALFVTAGKMLNDLAGLESGSALRRRIKYYTAPTVLVVDEVAYSSYSNRHADLLFEIISQRYEVKSTLVTTNKPFSEWGSSFTNASCVVSIIDRLVHKSEIIGVDAEESFRFKEAREAALKRKEARNQKHNLSESS